ncbi:Coenzyme PQQ synthesis protein D (PqqD) [Candidatus Electrothrix laxa]
MQLDIVLIKADNIVTRKVMDETLLVPISGELASMDNLYSLNETGACVWEALDGSRSLAEIGAQLERLYDTNLETIESDLLDLVSEFFEAGLVVEAVRS